MSPTSPQPPGGAARHAACTKVHRDSRSIHKQQASSSSPPSSSSTHSSVSSSSTNSRRPAPPPRQNQPQQQQRRPVIIYTHSPKVIRTSPRDFMSIVQKLTGLDPARASAGSPAAAAQDESSSSSESCAHAHAAAAAHPYADPRMMPPPPPPPLLDAHLVAPPDIPLFAPGPSELQLCVPQGLYDEFPAIDAAQLGPVMHSSNNMNGGAAGNGGGAVFSPSMVEAMRTFTDY